MVTAAFARWLPDAVHWRCAPLGRLFCQPLPGWLAYTAGRGSCHCRRQILTDQWAALATSGAKTVLFPTETSAIASGAVPASPHLPSAEVQAHLSLYTVDVPKLLQRYPPIGSYKLERVQRVTSFLDGLGVDVKCAVKKYYWVLTGKVEKYEAVVQLLKANKIDVARVVNRTPNILARRVASLQRTMDAITDSGHSVADIFHRHPEIHRTPASNISTTLQWMQARQNPTAADKQLLSPSPPVKEDPRGILLASLGLDSDCLLLKAPQLLGLKVENLCIVVEFLKGLGIDVPKVVRLAPRVLAMRPDTLQRRVQFLSDNGLDVVRIVNGFPGVLYKSVEGKLRPVFDFVVQEMGRSPSELNGAYTLWGPNLKDRLRPRFFYLQSLGRSSYSLSQFGSLSDERFAVSLARTDLLHYYTWRQQNGYHIPAHSQTAGGTPSSVSPLVSNNTVHTVV
eukprot:EG_transcript_11072